MNALITEAFLSANATDPLGEALFNAYSTVGYVAIKEGEYDPIEETGCSLGMIEEEYCKEPIPENLGNVGNNNSTSPTPAPVGGDQAAPTHPHSHAPTEKPVSSGSIKCFSTLFFTTVSAIVITFF